MSTLNPVFRTTNGDQEILHTPGATITKEGGRVVQVITKDDLDIRPAINQPGSDFLSVVKTQRGEISNVLKSTAFLSGFFGAALMIIGTIGLYWATKAPAPNAKQEEEKRIYQVHFYTSIVVGLIFAIFSYRLNASANEFNNL